MGLGGEGVRDKKRKRGKSVLAKIGGALQGKGKAMPIK